MKCLPFFSFFGFFLIAETAQILSICPVYKTSHYLGCERLSKKLAEKGHDVDVATTNFISKNPPPRFNQISLLGSVESHVSNVSYEVYRGMSHRNLVHIMSEFGVNTCRKIFKWENMKNLKNTQHKYDLVITEIFRSDCMLGFGHFFKVPVVSLITGVALPWANERIGNTDNPSYIPNYFASSTSKMSFFERIQNTLQVVLSKYWYNGISTINSNQISKEFFGPDLPNIEELAFNTSLILVNSHPAISHARPTVPNFVEIGGLHIDELKPLSKHFENMLRTDSAEGIIYVSMGSMILSETFDQEKLQGMFDAFSELPFKVIWKATREKFSKKLKIPENIYFVKWVPQLEILCHPNLKLFVTHGGVLGFQESVYCGVPVLGIPLLANQFLNVQTAESLGVAVRINYEEIKKETVMESIRKLLENPIFKNNAERISLQFKDRPLSALDEAVYWVEYVIRHHGAFHLRSHSAVLSWYQHYLVDVSAIFIFNILTILLLVIVVIKAILRLY